MLTEGTGRVVACRVQPWIVMSESESSEVQSMVEGGLTASALPAIRRDLFMDALAVARHDHDPSSEWEQFCEAAWREAALAFGFAERESWPGAAQSQGDGLDQRDGDDAP